MRYLLSRACEPLLAHLARQRTLCAFDFDGTLTPIVPHPGDADLPEETRQLLARLARLYPCVVLSGRSRTDVLQKLKGVKLRHVIGSHGAERKGSNRKWPEVQRWKTILDEKLNSVPGLWVEDKGLSLAVHYRQAQRKAEVCRKILKLARNLDKVRVFGGKEVINLTVDGAPNKGVALAAELRRLRCDWALYIGDDENDEDAFAISGNIVGVRVGWKRASKADYYLRAQAEVDTVLQKMAILRGALAEQ